MRFAGRAALWVGGFALALWAMLAWGASTNPHTDFAQNVWLPARLVLAGANPYSPAPAQVAGALGSYSPDFTTFNSGRSFHFIYPIWVALLLLPYAAIPLATATAIWRAASLVLLVWACGALLRSSNEAFRRSNLAAYCVLGFTLFLCFIFRADILNLYIGQFAVVGLALLAAVWCWLSRSGRQDAFAPTSTVVGDLLAGVALAVLATKPQTVGLVVLLLVAWAVARRRWAIPMACAATLLGLLLLPLLLYPSSLTDWLGIVLARQAWSQAPYSASVWGVSYNWLGATSPWVAASVVLSLGSVVLLLPHWWADMRDRANPVPLSLPLTLCVNSVISPYMLGYEHVLLLMPCLLLLGALGLPDSSRHSMGRSVARLFLYSWLAVLPFVTGVLQSISDKDYPIILQALTMLAACWWALHNARRPAAYNRRGLNVEPIPV